jgi:hypothetical protein
MAPEDPAREATPAKRGRGRPRTIAWLLAPIWLLVENELQAQMLRGEKPNVSAACRAVTENRSFTLRGADKTVADRIRRDNDARVRDIYYRAERLRATADPGSQFMQRIASTAAVGAALRARLGLG